MYYLIRNKYILFVLAISLLAYACSEKQQNHEHEHHHTETTGNARVDSLKQQVMAVHDEIMPKMDEIMSLRISAQQEIKQQDSLTKVNPKLEDTHQKQQLDSLLTQLDDADEAMMHWMQEFDSQMKAKSDEEKITYLKSEQDKINAVKDQMLGSISKGKQLLKK